MNAHPNVNDAMIMMGVHGFGFEPERPAAPLVAKVILAGDQRAPSVRRTVPRTASETAQQFYQRVIDTTREMKAGRSWDHTVSIFFSYENRYSAAEWFTRDAKWNMRQIDIHLAYHSNSAKRRVDALCRLADIH